MLRYDAGTLGSNLGSLPMVCVRACRLHSQQAPRREAMRHHPTDPAGIHHAFWFASALGGFALHFVNYIYTIGVHYATGHNELSVMFIGIACCGLIFWNIAHLVREYCRDVTTMCQHIGHFRVATAEIFCCSVEHRNPHSKDPMLCDREVMQRCINIWFGGIETFEQQVQGDLYNLLVDQLSDHMVSYWRLAEASPVFFFFLTWRQIT